MIFNEEVKKLRGVELNTIPMIQDPFEEMIKELERGALTRSSWAVVHFHELLLKFSLLTNLSIHLGEDLMGKELFEIYANVIDTRAKGFGSLLGTSRELSKILQKMVESNRLEGSSLQHAQNLDLFTGYLSSTKVGKKDIVQWRNTQLAHATALSSEDDQNNQKDLKSLVTSLVDFLNKNKEYFNKTLFEEVKLAPFITQREDIAYLYDQLKKDTYYPLFVSYNSNADQLVDKENKEIKAIYDQVKNCLVLDNSDSSAEGNTYTKEEKETIEQIFKDNRHEKFTFIEELLNEAIQENPTGARFLIRMESGMGKSTFVRQMLGGLGMNNSGIIYKAFFCNNIFAFSHETFTNTCLETLKQFEGSTLEGLTLSGRQGFADSMVNLFNDALNIYKERSQDNTKIVFFIDGIDELTLKNENFLKDFLEIDLNEFNEQIYFVFTCRSKSDTSDYINQIIDKNNFSKILEISKKDAGYQQMLENFVKKYRPNITNDALKDLFKYIDNKFLAMDLYIKILDELPDTLEHVWDNDAERYLSSLKSLYGGINYQEIEKLIAYFCLIPLPITLDLLKGFVGAHNITFQLLCYLKIISPLIDTRRGEYETYFSITRPEFTGYRFESTQDILEDMKAEIVEYYDESLKEEKIKDYDFVKHFSNIISLKYNKRNLSGTVAEIKSIVRSVIEGQEFEELELKYFARDFNLAMALVDKTFLIRKMEVLLSCVHPYLKKKDDSGSLSYVYDKNKDQKVLVQSLFFISYYNVKKESPDELLRYTNNLLEKLEYIESPEKIKIIEKMFAIVAQSLPDSQVFLWAQTLNRMADILTQASRAILVIEQMESLVNTLEVPEKELLKQSLALAYLDVQEFEFAKQSIIDARNYINNTRKPKILAIQNATSWASIEHAVRNHDESVNILRPYRSFVDDIRLRDQSLNDLFIIVKYFETYANITVKSDSNFAQKCLNRALEIYSLTEHKYKIPVLLYQVENYITRSRLHQEAQESYIILQKGVSLVEQNKHGETGKLLIKLYEAIIELFRVDTNINNNISRESCRKLILEYSFKIIDICDSLEKNNLVFDKDKKLHMVARISELSKDFEHPECIKSFDDLDEDNSHIHILDTQHEFERAVLENNVEKMGTLTKDNKIDLDYFYDFDKTALMLAVEYGALDAAEWLIDHGSDINLCDVDGRSTLSIACGRGYITIVEKLLSTNKLDKYYQCTEIYYIENPCMWSSKIDKEDILANPYPLIEAAKNGYLNIVKLLLDYGMDIDTGAGRGENALISSLKNGYTNIAKYLIEQGADINYKGEYSTRFYIQHISYPEYDPDEYDDVEKYIDNVSAGPSDSLDPKEEIYYTQSPIDIAIENGYVEIIQLLIAKGADKFLLMMADAVERNDLDTVQSLLNPIPDLSDQGRLKMRDIFNKAAIKGKIDIVKKLIQSGISVYEKRSNRYEGFCTTYNDLLYLTDVIRNGHTDTFLYLLSEVCEQYDSGDYNRHEWGTVIIQSLIDASSSGNLEVLKEMAESFGLDFFVKIPYIDSSIFSQTDQIDNRYKSSTLHVAAQNGHFEVVKFLLGLGIDVNKKDTNDRPPIYLAIENGYLDIVKILLDNGAILESKFLETFLELACSKGDVDMTSFLFDYMDKQGDIINTVYLTKLRNISQARGYKGTVQVIEKEMMKTPNSYVMLIAMKGEWDNLKYLLAKGADINTLNSNGDTLLSLAVRNSNLEITRELLENGANINAKNKYGRTPLFYAVVLSRLEIIQELLGNGADINAKDKDGRTPLFAAARTGDLEILQKLLENGANINAKNKYGETPLFHAVSRGYLEIVHELLDLGADFDPTDNMLLHIAAQKRRLKIFKFLLEIGLDINLKNSEGKTPLHSAVEGGNLEVIRELLDRGVDTNIEDNSGKTPLYLAVQDGNLEVIRELLDRGADINRGWNVLDKSSNPIYLVFENGYFKVLRFLLNIGIYSKKWPVSIAIENGQFKIIKLLLDNGVSFEKSSLIYYLEISCRKGYLDIASLLLDRIGKSKDITDTVYLTKLLKIAKDYKKIVHLLEKEMMKEPNAHIMLIAMKGEWGNLKYLLDKGADINSQDNDGKTPLYLAVQAGNLEITQELLDKGADINSQDNDGKTPLYLAVQAGNLKITQELLDKGADANIRNSEGKTPLYLAVQAGNLEIVGKLLSRDADVNTVEWSTYTRLDGDTPRYHFEDLVQLQKDMDINDPFIEQDGNPIHENNSGWTLLHLATRDGNLEIVRALLDRGANISKDYYNVTPLHIAVQKGNLEIAKILLERGADVNEISHRKILLHLAVKGGNLGIVRELLDRGADVNEISHRKILLHLAVEGGNLGIVRGLLDRGADVNREDHYGNTALDIAEQCGNLEIVKELLDRGAKSKIDYHDKILLYLAVRDGDLKKVRELLSKGIDINSKYYSKILLYLAEKDGNLEIARKLTDQRFSGLGEGETLLYLAEQREHKEIQKELLGRGADISRGFPINFYNDIDFEF